MIEKLLEGLAAGGPLGIAFAVMVWIHVKSMDAQGRKLDRLSDAIGHLARVVAADSARHYDTPPPER